MGAGADVGVLRAEGNETARHRRSQGVSESCIPTSAEFQGHGSQEQSSSSKVMSGAKATILSRGQVPFGMHMLWRENSKVQQQESWELRLS